MSLFTTDCKIIKIKQDWIYPIFKNAYTSLILMREDEKINNDVSKVDNIIVYIRNQRQRFVSGVGEVLYNNPDVDKDKLLADIMESRMLDRHFCPQSVWLLHLYRFYKGPITLKDISQVAHHTPAKLNTNVYSYLKLEAPDSYVSPDEPLKKYIDKKINLAEIVPELLHVLS